ncbi:MAG: AAA family ATPase [Magnetospiraceae bacterium]
MFVIAVANTKGGVGKSTVATHLAAHFAGRGQVVALADFDRQRSSLSWLDRRPANAAPILGIKPRQGKLDLPRAVTHLIVDTSAALGCEAVKETVKHADAVVIPALPSAFDEDGIRRFLKHLSRLKPIRKQKRAVCFVINRSRPAQKSTAVLESFLARTDFPVVARLRDSQIYVTLASEGRSVFDLTTQRARGYQEDWAPLLDFLQAMA